MKDDFTNLRPPMTRIAGVNAGVLARAAALDASPKDFGVSTRSVEAARLYGDWIRAAALEEAARLVQEYNTFGDYTQGWQDRFAEAIRALKGNP